MLLVSPSFRPVIGVRMNDGSVEEFDCLFHWQDDYPQFIYIFSVGVEENVLLIDGQMRLVDREGNDWTVGEVEQASILLNNGVGG